MAVPASIRAVERPSNTIIEDNGRDGPNRYAVRLRAGVKYVPGGNPQPRNGKVIGHIVDGKYVPVNAPVADAKPEMLQYGASAFVYSVSADLIECLQHHDDRIPPGNAAVHIFKPAGIVLQENLYQPVLSRCGSF